MAAMVRTIWTTKSRYEISTWVGEAGQIFYNPDDGVLRISDGVTPGGRILTGAGGQPVTIATATQAGIVKIGENVNITADGTISVTKGAGINKITDINDVYSVNLGNGSVLVYNLAANRWETRPLEEQQGVDGGFF